MKKRIVGLMATVMVSAASAFALTACDGCNDDKEKDKNTGSDPSTTEPDTKNDVYAVTVNGDQSREIDVGATDALTWKVTKNGTEVNDEEVLVTSEGSVSYANGTVTGTTAGRGYITVELKNHSDADVVTITYNVVNYFFSRDIKRGNVNLNKEDKGTVSILGDQATLVAKKADTKFVFRAKITIKPETELGGGVQSLGIGSFLDGGDHALWFGVRDTDGENDDCLAVYIRNFYTGWNSPATDGNVTGYSSCNVGREIDFEIIRDGADYWYSVDGYHGKYTDPSATDTPTYPGIYSQTIPFDISDFSVDYDRDAVETAAAAYDTKGVAAVNINESTKLRRVRGSTYNYTAAAYPSYATGALTWELDKTQLTAGAEGTTVTDGALTIAADAVGKIGLICKSGDISHKIIITVLEHEDVYENSFIKATGGVGLNTDTNVLTFGEEFITVDGVENEENYVEADYAAYLKQNLKRDFSVEFKVSNYKRSTVAGRLPKLQLSLGYEHSNFYVVYSQEHCRIEAYCEGLTDDGLQKNWYVTDDFTDFNPDAEHTYKVKVGDDGVYTVYLDGHALTFHRNEDSTPIPLMRKYEAYNSSLPVKFATKNVSATVSGITVVDGTAATLPDWWVYYDEYVEFKTGGFDLKFTEKGWDAQNAYLTRIQKTAALPQNFVIEYDVEFVERMADSKLGMIIGDRTYYVNNKLNGTENAITSDINFAGATVVTNKGADILKAHVRLERNNGAIRFIVNNVIVAEQTNTGSATTLEFFTFNLATDEGDKVSVTNFTIGEYQRADVYEMTAALTAIDLQPNADTTISWTTKLNGETYSDGTYTAQITSGNGVISYNESTRTITALQNGTATLKITLDGHDDVFVIYEIEVSTRRTENTVLTVTGGVILHDDDSIEFPVSKRGTNGIGNQESYEAQNYSANLKTTVKGDFAVEFKFSNYATTSDSPKLMLSLGGTHNQFYIVCKNDGTYRIETFTNTLNAGGSVWAGGSWCNTQFAPLDTSAEHTFKVAVVNGKYEVYMDNVKLNFGVENGDTHVWEAHNMVRSYDSYVQEQPIRISTNGVSCIVKDITVTGGTGISSAYFAYNTDHVTVSGNDLTLTVNDGVWNDRTTFYNRVAYATPLLENCAIDFDVDFSKQNMGDAKLIIRIGEWEYHICKEANGWKAQFCKYTIYNNDNWKNQLAIAGTDGNTTSAHVRLERNNGKARLIVNNTVIVPDGNESVDNTLTLEFWAFNSKAEDKGATVTVSNLTTGAYSMLDVYTIEAVGSTAVTLNAGKTKVIDWVIKKNGETVTDVAWEYSFATAGQNVAAFNATTKTITAQNVGSTTLTIKLQGKDIELIYPIEVSARPTENSLLSVNGGVILENDDVEHTAITFDTAHADTDGVGSQTDWDNSKNYSANFKQTVKGDFSIEFIVSDYKVTETEGDARTYPKLMISLGGSHNQFYIAYKPNGEYRVESFTNVVDSNNLYSTGGSWCNSANFTAFNTTTSHKYKIACVNGIYHVYMDDVELAFNVDNSPKTMARRYEDYIADRPIRIATNGVSCTVSEIKLEQGSAKNWYYTNTANVTESGNDVVLKLCNGGWGASDTLANTAGYTGVVPADCNISLDAIFSETPAPAEGPDDIEGKLCIKIGSWQYHISLKKDGWYGECFSNNSWKGGTKANDGSTALSAKIEFTRVSGALTSFRINGTEIPLNDYYDTSATTIMFYAFNGNSLNENKTLTVANLSITTPEA